MIYEIVIAVVGTAMGCCASYLLIEMARTQRAARLAQYDQPTEAERPELPEEREARLLKLIEEGQNHAGRIKEEWVTEKRSDGWTDEEINSFLEDRPLLDLN